MGSPVRRNLPKKHSMSADDRPDEGYFPGVFPNAAQYYPEFIPAGGLCEGKYPVAPPSGNPTHLQDQKHLVLSCSVV